VQTLSVQDPKEIRLHEKHIGRIQEFGIIHQ